MSRLRVPISDRDHVLGSAGAEIELVEYGDYQCPFCGEAYWVVQQILRRLGRDLHYAFRHFPISEIHPMAVTAAEAAEAAGAQGNFWRMHDAIYENREDLDMPHLLVWAEQLGLDLDRFTREIESGMYMARIRDDFTGGVRSGVNGTPCFFINGERHDGGWDTDSLLFALERARRHAAASAPR
ncbi:MAG: DsbA family protein [Kofleriaceae bacterium]